MKMIKIRMNKIMINIKIQIQKKKFNNTLNNCTRINQKMIMIYYKHKIYNVLFCNNQKILQMKSFLIKLWIKSKIKLKKFKKILTKDQKLIKLRYKMTI